MGSPPWGCHGPLLTALYIPCNRQASFSLSLHFHWGLLPWSLVYPAPDFKTTGCFLLSLEWPSFFLPLEFWLWRLLQRPQESLS